MSVMYARASAALAVAFVAACAGRGAEGYDLAGRLRALDARVLAPGEARRAAEAMRKGVRARLRATSESVPPEIVLTLQFHSGGGS